MFFEPRYDLFVGYIERIAANMTCEEYYAQLPICNTELRIQNHNVAPYMHTLPNGVVDGIIPGRLPLHSVTFLTYLLRAIRL